MCVCTRACVRRAEDNLWELILSFQHVEPEHQTQGPQTRWQELYPLTHLSSPRNLFIQEQFFGMYNFTIN